MLLLTSLAVYGNIGCGDSSSELGRLSRLKWTFDNSLIEIMPTGDKKISYITESESHNDKTIFVW